MSSSSHHRHHHHRSPPRRHVQTRDRNQHHHRDRQRSRSPNRQQQQQRPSSYVVTGGNGSAAGAAGDDRVRQRILENAAKRNPLAKEALETGGGDSVKRALAMQREQPPPSGTRPSRFSNAPSSTTNRTGNGSTTSTANTRPQTAADLARLDKVLMELHVGGIPDAIDTNEAFADFLNDLCAKQGLTTEPGNPILSARITAAGHFAFVTFRSKEEATLGLGLNGSSCLGATLRVERPKGYAARIQQLANEAALGTRAGAATDEAAWLDTALSVAPLVASIPGVSREELKMLLEKDKAEIGDPTNNVEVFGIVDFDQCTRILSKDAVEAIKSELEYECSKILDNDTTVVVQVRLPLHAQEGVLLQTTSIFDAVKLVDKLNMSLFDGSTVRARFHV